MTSNIIFQFESNQIRFVGTAENPEWIAADICKVLDIVNVSDAMESLDPDEKGIANTDDGSLTGSQMLTVTEAGLYRLIFKSRKPAAKRMRKWVFSEVLPSIRKTGRYATPVAPQLPSRELAVETAVAIDRIQDILSKSNPRLAQILIDCAMNDVADFSRSLPSTKEFPEDKWYGLVQIASKMGIATSMSTRVKLGQHISKLIKKGALDVERVREERLCNGQQEEIWCYRDDSVVRSAIQEWADNLKGE